MGNRSIPEVTLSVARVDRNDDNPGLNWLVILSTGSSAFGVRLCAAEVEWEANAFANRLSAQNGWSVKYRVENAAF